MKITIIGAGPAGLLCGLKLLEKGIGCKIIEKKKEIGKPLQCAEGISKEAIELIEDENLIKKIVRKKFKGSLLTLPSDKKIYFKREGFLIKRERLEKFLAEKFIKMGGEIVWDEVKGIEKNEIHAKNSNYRSDLIIIATGCNFIKGVEYPYKRFLFCTEKRIVKKKEKDFLEFYHGEKYRPIYLWKFYHGEFTGIGKAYKNKEDFESLKKILQNQKLIKTITGKVPFPLNPPEFLYHDRKFFIGDAGAFVHQLTFAGIHGAFLSAILCADVVEKFLTKNIEYELEKYNLLLKNLPYFKKSLYRARNILYSSSDNELKVIGNLMDKREYIDVPYGKAIINLLKNPLFLKPYIKFLWIQKIYKMSEKFSF